MKYINSDIILNNANLKSGKYAWLLLGEPQSASGVPASGTADGSRDPSFVSSTKEMKIRDETIAGISFCQAESILGVTSDTGNEATITFPASGKNTEIFCRVGNEYAPTHGFRVNNLALVKIKSNIHSQIFSDNTYNSDKARENFFYFKQEQLPDNEWTFEYKTDATNSSNPNYRMMGKIDAVLVIYSINSSAEDPVNFINYTGFNVGESVLTISGLNQE